MHIDSPTFTHRRVLQPPSYSPKRRWDENVFGSERNLLMNHVENALKEHDNDGDILERFRREAEEQKEKKRRERFPHLYQGSGGMKEGKAGQRRKGQTGHDHNSNALSVQPVQTNQFMSESFMVKQRQHLFTHHPSQQQPQLNNNPPLPLLPVSPYPFSFPSPYPLPPAYYPSQPNNLPQQTLLTYQRRISQKNLQLHKKQEKIKRQKQQIKHLYQKLKEREKHDQLEIYVKEREEVRRLEEVVGGMGRDIRENWRVVEGLRGGRGSDYRKVVGNRDYGERINSDNYEGINSDDNNHAQRNSSNNLNNNHNHSLLHPNPTTNPTNNPQIIYSPTTKRNKSSIFSNIPLYNPYTPPLTRQPSISEHLNELRNYNKRLEYLNGENSEKLSRLGKNGGSEGR